VKDPIYLDNAATTPVLDKVTESMLPYFGGMFGNPSSSHSFGRAARAGMDSARRTIGDIFGIDPSGVIFTGGGTEGDNLAVLGGALADQRSGGSFHVARADTEHKAVLGASKEVERAGGKVSVLEVDTNGIVDVGSLERIIASRPSVVSVMWVNNETGVVQDMANIAGLCSEAGVTFHTDAVQAIGKVPCAQSLPWTMLTISGHKIGAPKGIGVLLIKDPSAVVPLSYGGGQQQGMRSGTENVAAIVGLAAAIELAASKTDEHASEFSRLRDELEKGILDTIPDVAVNCFQAQRAPHISNISFAGTDSESLIMNLDMAGIACSSGSACESGAVKPSYVLNALGFDDARATSALRLSFSEINTRADIVRVLDELPGIVARVRKLNSALGR
jgi:cysteine desulfurase